ncbi:hypothetical protein [Bifidobacterium leontopitheci]|nr:hypothetical protein [Bifidobacterium leontopitheci]
MDLGITRMQGEDDARFVCRISYSALRFWMQAFCLDDGYGGSYGVSRSAIVRKSTLWLRQLSGLYPQVLDWYEHGDDMDESLSGMLGTLASAGDLVRTGDGLYRCAVSHDRVLTDGSVVALGMTDPTDMESAMPLSGMACVSFGESGAESGQLVSDMLGSGRLGSGRAGRRHSRWPFDTDDLTLSTRVGSVRLTRRDDRHAAVRLPRLAPDSVLRWQIDLLTWPVAFAGDMRNRIVRVEYVPVVVRLVGGVRIESD